jgi:hypothetical protein
MKTQRERLLDALEQGWWTGAWDLILRHSSGGEDADGSIDVDLAANARFALYQVGEAIVSMRIARREVDRILRGSGRSAPDHLTDPDL